MGREIEIKIPLEKSQFENLQDVFFYCKNKIEKIEILKDSQKEILKSDEYWSRFEIHKERIKNGEPQVIRIRTEKIKDEEKSYFTLKRKTCENGIELNKEDETFVQNADVLREFFEISGYRRWFRKTKKSFGSLCKTENFPNLIFHVEIEKVNDFFYAEIEVTQEDFDAKFIKNALNAFALQIGLNPQKKDSRSWMEILQEDLKL